MKAIILAGINLLRYESPIGDKHNSPSVWNKYANTTHAILNAAVSAPAGTFLAPKAKNAKPIPSKNNPKKYLTDAGGLYLLSHHLVNNGANIMMNREFKIANQVIGTSDSEDDNSVDSLYPTMAQTMTKLKPRMILDKPILVWVLLKSWIST